MDYLGLCATRCYRSAGKDGGVMLLYVERHWRFAPESRGNNLEATIVFQIGSRWIRLGVFYGTPPGSHIGFWRTQWADLRGLNLRIGRRYIGPCLGFLAHTRRRPCRVVVVMDEVTA